MRACAIVTCSACYAFCMCRKSASKFASRTPCCPICALCVLCVCFLRCPRAAHAACNEAKRAARILPRIALPDRNVPSVDNGICKVSSSRRTLLLSMHPPALSSDAQLAFPTYDEVQKGQLIENLGKSTLCMVNHNLILTEFCNYFNLQT